MNSSSFFNVAHVDLPKDAIVGLVGSKFVNGFFTKKNGEARPFWGRLVLEERDGANILTIYDNHLKQYRRLDLSRNYAFKSGDLVFANLSAKKQLTISQTKGVILC